MNRIVLAWALALVACAPDGRSEPLPPTDRFYFPTGVAVTKPSGGGTALLVASSNFDLRYSVHEGGTLLSVDPTVPADGTAVVALGAELVSSYAGDVAVADATTCPGIATPGALVASRFDDLLYRFNVGATGGLACGAGCARRIGGAIRDPYAITVACGGTPARRTAYVGWLVTPASPLGSGAGGWVTEVDLDDPLAPTRDVLVGDGPVRSMAYDAVADRLWMASRSSGERSLLHSVVLSDPTWLGPTPWNAVATVDLFPAVRGAELRSLALGSPPAVAGAPRRLYATARLYDVELQATTGLRPAADVGGVLIVMDVTDGLDGRPVVEVRRVVSLGTGVGDVAVVRRLAGRDVVVATELDGDHLFVWDDEVEAMALTLGRNGSGVAALGNRPMALAIDQSSPGAVANVYVADFGSHAVSSFPLDPGDPTKAPTITRIGGLAP